MYTAITSDAGAETGRKVFLPCRKISLTNFSFESGGGKGEKICKISILIFPMLFVSTFTGGETMTRNVY